MKYESTLSTEEFRGIKSFIYILRSKLPILQIQWWDINTIGKKYIWGEYHSGVDIKNWVLLLFIPFPFTKRRIIIRFTTFIK